MLLKAVNNKGGSGGIAHRSHSSFADGKAPGDLIPQMQAKHLLENKNHLLNMNL